MITILEGTDGVGKTTHARWLLRQLGGTLIHYGPPAGEDALLLYVDEVAPYVKHGPVILDRSSFGSLIWARMGFHAPTMGSEVLAAVCRTYARLGAEATILIRPPDHIARTLLDRGASDEDKKAMDISLRAQQEYVHMVVNHEILYVPVSLTSSDLANHERNHR